MAIKIAGLQEEALDELIQLIEARVEEQRAAGIGAELAPARTLRDVVQLTKRHNVRTAEVAHRAMGILAWRDEAPGVGFIELFAVNADCEENVAAALLQAAKAEAAGLKLPQMIARVPTKDAWLNTVLSAAGFSPVNGDAPKRVTEWTAGGEDRAARPEESLLWANTSS